MIITGPTASGKTPLAEMIAVRINGEIISADSRTLYRDLTIGTGGYSNSNSVKYHLTGVIDIGTTYSAYEWVEGARTISDDIINREKIPIICGGTLHYIEMFINGMDSMPEPDGDLRNHLKAIAKIKGRKFVYEILTDLDPDLAEKVHPNNLERIVRYIERVKGNAKFEDIPPYKGDYELYFLLPDREYLERKITARVAEMIEMGWIDEVNKLKKKGHLPTTPGLNSIGYSEIFNYLDGRISLEEARSNILKNTLDYSKKQCKWIKRLDPKVINISREDDISQTAEDVLEFIDKCCRSRQYDF
jgi:tRNA dimethylallyltransferase